MQCPRPARRANLRYRLRQRVYAMPVQCSSSAEDVGVRSADNHIAAKRRSPGRRTVESLIGGLRAAYRLDDQAETSEVFADFIGRLHQHDDKAS